MEIHENTRNSWNFMKYREKGAVLAPDWKTYWIPIGIQWISDAPVGYTYLECTDFHGISGKSIEISEFRKIPQKIMGLWKCWLCGEGHLRTIEIP